MLFLKLLLIVVAFGFLACAAGLVLYDIYLAFELDRILRKSEPPAGAAQPAEAGAAGTAAGAAPLAALPGAAQPRARRALRWNGRSNAAVKFVLIASVLAFAGKSIVVVPDGEAAVRISQISGVLPGDPPARPRAKP